MRFIFGDTNSIFAIMKVFSPSLNVTYYSHSELFRAVTLISIAGHKSINY